MYIYKLIYTYKAQLDENPKKRPPQGSGTHGGGRQVTGTVKLRNSLKIVLKPQIFSHFGTVEILGPQEYSTEYSIGIL